MAKLTVLRGISGSGKSTWTALQPNNPVVVSRDRLRMAFFGTEEFIDENFITKEEHSAIRNALRAGRNVISDNTNIQLKYVREIVRIAEQEGASVEIKTFDVSLVTALSRNAERATRGGRNVPEHVIAKQHKGLSATLTYAYEPFVIEPAPDYDPNLDDIVLVDVDGTLAHMNDKRGPYDEEHADVDDLDESLAWLCQVIFEAGRDVILFSGRGQSKRAIEVLVEWLDTKDVLYDALFTRTPGDSRSDDLVKYDMYNEHIRGQYNVRLVFDDRAKVVRMWKRLGLRVANMAGNDDGEF